MNDIYFTVGYAYKQYYSIKDDKTGKIQQGYTLHAVVHKHDSGTGDIIRTQDHKCNSSIRDMLLEHIKKNTKFSALYYDDFGRLIDFVRGC